MGTPVHADLHIPASAAADPVNANGLMTGSGTLLFDPHSDGVRVLRLMLSVDAAMRVAVGVADQDGQRIRSCYLAANGGAAPDVCVEVPAGGKLTVWHSAQGNVDVSIDGELIGS